MANGGRLAQPRCSWEAGTEQPESDKPSLRRTNAAGMRTSAELSWLGEAVPSKLGSSDIRPLSPESPTERQRPSQKPAGEAHWTSRFGTATDWASVPGGLESPDKKPPRSSCASAPPAAADFLDVFGIDLGCASTPPRGRSGWSAQPEPEPEPEPTPERRKSPNTEERRRQRRPAALLPPPSPGDAAAVSLMAAIHAAHAPVLPAAFPVTPEHGGQKENVDGGTCPSPNQTSPPEPVRQPWNEVPTEVLPARSNPFMQPARRAEPWPLHVLIHTPASADNGPASADRPLSHGYTAAGLRLVRLVFERFDQDNDGHLSKPELRNFAMATEGEVYDDETLDDLLKSFRSGVAGMTLQGFVQLYRETELMDLARDVHQLNIA